MNNSRPRPGHSFLVYTRSGLGGTWLGASSADCAVLGARCGISCNKFACYLIRVSYQLIWHIWTRDKRRIMRQWVLQCVRGIMRAWREGWRHGAGWSSWQSFACHAQAPTSKLLPDSATTSVTPGNHRLATPICTFLAARDSNIWTAASPHCSCGPAIAARHRTAHAQTHMRGMPRCRGRQTQGGCMP